MYLRNNLSQKDCGREVIYVHGKDAVNDVQTSAPSPLSKRESNIIHLYAAPSLCLLQAAC